MPVSRRELWGVAVGPTRGGSEERINAFKTDTGFDFVNDRLYCHHIPAAKKQTPDQMLVEVARVFGLVNPRFEFPHLGIYAPPKAKDLAGNSKLANRSNGPRFVTR